MNKKFGIILLIIVIAKLYSCGSKQTVVINENSDYQNTETAEPAVIEPTRAELIMRALQRAYPDKIEKVEFRNDDWAILMRDNWYYHAGGRILPENRIEYAANYRALPFYHYPAELPLWTRPTPEEAERLRNWTSSRRQNNIRRSSYFLDALWRASTRIEIENNLVRINFFGRRIRVHSEIHEILTLVERQIRDAAADDPQVQNWVNTIGTVEGYSWRNIADTQARSYHSYGLAVDILPRALGRRQTYWLWTSQYREDWWNVPHSERYHPPSAVIKIFEENGFVWGGKWAMFDTMHFEYRPEILILNGLI
jgi:hypothetical protein